VTNTGHLGPMARFLRNLRRMGFCPRSALSCSRPIAGPATLPAAPITETPSPGASSHAVPSPILAGDHRIAVLLRRCPRRFFSYGALNRRFQLVQRAALIGIGRNRYFAKGASFARPPRLFRRSNGPPDSAGAQLNRSAAFMPSWWRRRHFLRSTCLMVGDDLEAGCDRGDGCWPGWLPGAKRAKYQQA